MRSLIWFRSDLRLRDNRALDAAARNSDDGLIAVFVVSPDQWRSHDWGTPKVDFVLRNLATLSDSLQKRNIPLVLLHVPRFADAPRELFGLAEKHGCQAIYFNDEYEVNEQERDRQTERLFAQHGLSVNRFCDQTILDVADFRTSAGGFYTVFTPFRARWIQEVERGPGIELLDQLRKQQKRPLASDFVPAALPQFPDPAPQAGLWPAGEDEAHRRLDRFVDRKIDCYDQTRGYPAADGTSRLSPYLALGVISPRECFSAALRANGGVLDGDSSGITAWINELIWREFYRHVLIGFPRVSKHRPFRLETEKIRWRDEPKHFDAWRRGNTGIPIVDAGMRQLAHEGWMHNRVRMIVASFFSKNLFQDWRRGEAFFMQSLLDGDLANNNGGWQWCASTGTDAAPYFRVFNPYLQGAKFDPEGDYVRRFVPELARLDGHAIHAPPEKRSWPRSIDYAPPLVDVNESRAAAIDGFTRSE